MEQRIIIQGGNVLCGRVEVSGAKNAALPIMAASLLTDGPCDITNVPDLVDIRTFSTLLQRLGVSVMGREAGKLCLQAQTLTNCEAPYNLVKTMRASVLVLGPLVARYGRARVSLPGGCAIGVRPIDQHLMGMRALGADIELENGYVHARARRLRGADIRFKAPTVTGTENLMMAAALADGRSRLYPAAREPEIVALAGVLNQMGGRSAVPVRIQLKSKVLQPCSRFSTPSFRTALRPVRSPWQRPSQEDRWKWPVAILSI
jgi:UDP-N-acetylglucosamine 1-carboxyvinyltransferase